MKDAKLPAGMRENVPLRDYSTFRIGGPARYFFVASSAEEAKSALDFAQAERLPVFVLGKGSNLLISDQGFAGLVIKLENRQKEVRPSADGFELELDAGLLLTPLVMDLARQGIGGLEWGAGIPATLGGALANNAGAHAHSLGEAVRAVRVLELKRHPEEGYLLGYSERQLSPEECHFSYRDSIFKRSKGFFILSALLSLSPGESEELQAEVSRFIQDRVTKQPLRYPNIGSIFKNPTLDAEQLRRVLRDRPEQQAKFSSGTIPAGWLIEEAGLKGQLVGGAQVSEQHANFIVNRGDARAQDVVVLISLIKQKVRVQFDLQLQEEIEYVGF